jgi:CheY-like chemotaxis protein
MSEPRMKKVLIVDDEVEIVELVSMVLEDEDLALLAAYDGQQALEIARQERPDLVLSDVMMPRLDGRELCRSLRADPEMRDVVIILMTAASRIDTSGCDPDETIGKPFDISSFARTIGRFLS